MAIEVKFKIQNSKFKILERVKNWIINNRLEAILLALILIVGAFLRLYRIDEYMTFLGDEGRDAIIVRRLLVDFDPILIGPRTSIGDMYLGPLYYYMMAPALLLSGFNPAGPAIMVALLGVVTVFFIWWIAREWFGKLAAFIAAFFYAISPVVIIYSRSSWNPNIMPFFALLCIYSIWKVWFPGTQGQAEDSRRFKWLIAAGVSFAFVLQSHYLGLLLAPTLGMFWLLTFLKIRNSKLIGKFLRNSLVGFIIFIGLMSPLVIFDARHGWRNFASMKKFFTERQTTVSARPWTALPKLPDVAFQTNTSLLGAKNSDLTWLYTYAFAALSLWVFIRIIIPKKKYGFRE